MPPYFPGKRHPPAHRVGRDKLVYWLYLRFGRRSRFWGRHFQEHEIYRILRVFACQQVRGFIANPEGVAPLWHLDVYPEDVQENRYPLNTCLLRGWLEEFKPGSESYEGFPIAHALIPPGGSINDFSKPPYYRLTSAGWNALYRQYAIARIALFISAIAFLISFLNALPNLLKLIHQLR
jgi:hypothetical protein